ncbi:MAG: hypothetical protein ACR2NX_12325 [Chthoniobacterales bacterium]
MSAPLYQFTCTKCDFEGRYAFGRGGYVYRLPDGSRAYVPRVVGWCSDCQTIMAIQSGISLSKLEQQCRTLEASLPPKPRPFLSRLFAKREDWKTQHMRSEIREKQQLLTLLDGRTALAACMLCGCTSVTPMELDAKCETTLLPYPHPGCGGRLIMTESARIAWQLRDPEIIEPVFADARDTGPDL